MSVKSRLHIPIWLFALLFGVFILRVPSFFEPYFYGDEMIYMTLGNAINKGLVLYRDIHDNKPPLLYAIAAISGNLFWFKAILALWSMIVIVLFYKLIQKLFNSQKITLTATIAFATLTTLPLLEGNVANAENFMIGATIAGFLVLLSKKLTNVTLLAGGFMFAIAALFKIPASFDLPVIFIYWIITKTKKESWVVIIRQIIFVSIGFASPILLTLIYYFLRGAGEEYLIAAFLQNVGYLSSFRPDDVVKPFFVRNAPLLVRMGIGGIAVFTLFGFRKKFSKGFLLAALWLITSAFAVTLSERPYPHYLLQAVPAISALIAILIASTKMEQVYTVPLLLLSLAIPVYYKFYHYDSVGYYKKFINFSIGKTNQQEYFNSFDQNTSRNYEISKLLIQNTRENDNIFVWGDSPTVYALSKRLPPLKYVATYHINDFSTQEAVLSSIENSPPKYIVVLPDSAEFTELSIFLETHYVQTKNIDRAQIWQYVSPALRSYLK